MYFRLNCPRLTDPAILADLYSRDRIPNNSDKEHDQGGYETGISTGEEGQGQVGNGDGKRDGQNGVREKGDQQNGGKAPCETGQQTKRYEHGEKGERSEDGSGETSSSGSDGLRKRRPHSSSHPFSAEEERSLLHHKGHDQWEEGYRRRHELRTKHGHQSRPHHDVPSDPHGSIPHASTGKKVHTGRGGFPGLQGLITALFNHIFPGQASQISKVLRRYEQDGVHSSHPFQSLKEMVEKPLKGKEDKRERNEANNAKWLPPGVRSVIVGRHSQFFEEELSDEDLRLLGALEYRATKVLTVLIVGVNPLNYLPV